MIGSVNNLEFSPIFHKPRDRFESLQIGNTPRKFFRIKNGNVKESSMTVISSISNIKFSIQVTVFMNTYMNILPPTSTAVCRANFGGFPCITGLTHFLLSEQSVN
jgi:hypothetical protein